MAMGALALARKMAGKKRPEVIQWQQEVTNDEEWEELTQRNGLTVVDVYQEWCGPCVAMASHLKEMKLQLGEEMLHCATAKADTINRLKRFRGRSEPTWLFLASGQPVAVVQGANVPLLRQTLLAELKAEKRVSEEGAERKTLDWQEIGFSLEEEEAELLENKPKNEKEPVTLLVLTDEALNEIGLEEKLKELLEERQFQLLQKLILDPSALCSPAISPEDKESTSNSPETEAAENTGCPNSEIATQATEITSQDEEKEESAEPTQADPAEFLARLGEKFEVWIIDSQNQTASDLSILVNDLMDQFPAPDDHLDQQIEKRPNYFFLPDLNETKFLSTRIQRHILQQEPTEAALLTNTEEETALEGNEEVAEVDK